MKWEHGSRGSVVSECLPVISLCLGSVSWQLIGDLRFDIRRFILRGLHLYASLHGRTPSCIEVVGLEGSQGAMAWGRISESLSELF